MVLLGITKGDDGASVQVNHTGGTGEVLACVVWEIEAENKEQEERMSYWWEILL